VTVAELNALAGVSKYIPHTPRRDTKLRVKAAARKNEQQCSQAEQ